jgi:transposase
MRNLARSRESVIAEAIRYGFNHWDGLVQFLEDGRIEMDTNSVERAIRPIALNRKNSLFAGHDQGAVNWACLASLIETAKLHGLDPQGYLRHPQQARQRLADGQNRRLVALGLGKTKRRPLGGLIDELWKELERQSTP